jgi:hypothetical protein
VTKNIIGHQVTCPKCRAALTARERGEKVILEIAGMGVSAQLPLPVRKDQSSASRPMRSTGRGEETDTSAARKPRKKDRVRQRQLTRSFPVWGVLAITAAVVLTIAAGASIVTWVALRSASAETEAVEDIPKTQAPEESSPERPKPEPTSLADQSQKGPELLHLDVRQIKREWSENTARFTKLYRGKWVCLRGVVGKVKKASFNDKDCLELRDSNAIVFDLDCIFMDSERLVQFKPNESVRLVGVMDITPAGTRPFLDRCYLVSGDLADDPQARAMQQRALADEEREKRQREELATTEREKERQHELAMKKAEAKKRIEQSKADAEAERLRLLREAERATRAEEKAKQDADAARIKREDAKAKVLMRRANQVLNQGLKKAARQRYQEIIDQYPDTPTAEEARKIIEKIAGE